MEKGAATTMIAILMASTVMFGSFLMGLSTGIETDEMEEMTAFDTNQVVGPEPSASEHFTRNDGQWKSGLQYVGKAPLGYVGFSEEGVYFNVIKEAEDNEIGDPIFSGHVLKLSFEGGSGITPVGEDEIGTEYNYLIGEETNWVTHVPNFKNVLYQNVWNGIDVKYGYSDSDVKYDIIVRPGADLSDIQITMAGQKALIVNDDNLEINVDGEVRIIDTELDVFYLDDPSEKVEASFERIDEDTYSFSIGEYDTTKTLVIDPLYYGTYLGSAGADYGYGIGVDGASNAYAIGYTTYSSSGEFPTTPGAYQQYRASTSYDAFVTKFHYSGKEIYYSTFIGGYNSDYCYGGTADNNGYAYLTGYTYYSSSGNYPSTSGAYQRSINTAYSTSYYDTFVTKVSQDGSSLAASTFIGSAYYEYGYGIDVDSNGYVYICGRSYYSSSINPSYGEYPVTSGAFQTSRSQYTAYATKFNPSLSALVWSTFMGGTSTSTIYAWDIAADNNGNAYVCVYTAQTDFPTTSGAYQTTFGGTSYDAAVVKLSSSTGAGIYSTYLGGSSTDYGYGIAADNSGCAYVSGYTTSSNFPVTSGAYDTTYNGYEIFVTKFNSAGTGLVYSTFLGSSSSDYTYYHNIKVDSSGQAYVNGYTSSSGYPTTSDRQQSTTAGSNDIVATTLNAAGNGLIYSTYLGGSSAEYPYGGVEIDSYGTFFVTGYTASSNFPTIIDAYDRTYYSTDVFVARFGKTFTDTTVPSVTDTTPTSSIAYTGMPFTVTATASDNVGLTNLRVEYWSGTGSHSTAPLSMITGRGTFIVPDSVNTLYWFVYATDANSNYASTTTRTTTPVDASGPSFSNIGSNPYPPVTGSPVNITVDVWDNVAYDPTTVKLYYRDSQTASYTQVSMSRAVNDTFYYIGQVSRYWDGLYFYFTAQDTSNNLGTSTVYYQKVLDVFAPTLVSDGSATSATTGDAYTFQLTMNDNIGIGYAYVEYWYGTGSHTQRALSISGSGYGSDQVGSTSITIPYTSMDTLYYFYHFRDRDGNYWTSGPSSTVTVPVYDNDAPVITYVKVDDSTTGDPYVFVTSFTDNIDGAMPETVSIDYCYNNNWATFWTLYLTYDSGSQTWSSSSITVQARSLDPITFIVKATDYQDNTIEQGGYSIRVLDNDLPVLNSDGTSNAGTTGDPHNFTVNAEDNIAIGRILLNMKYGSGYTFNNIGLTQGANNDWYLVKPLMHTLTSLTYNFTIIDTSGNRIKSTDKVITMTDNDLPQIYSDMTRQVAKAGEEQFPLRIMISDNIGLGPIKVYYWYSFDTNVREDTPQMQTTGVYIYFIDLPKISGSLYYKFSAYDVPTGNYYETAVSEVLMSDTTSPEISNIIHDETATTGEELTLSATITDDLGVTQAKVHYYFGSGPVMFNNLERSGDTYSYKIPVPHNLAPIYFWIEASDQKMNRATSEIYMVQVSDNDLPSIDTDLSDQSANTGNPFKLRVNATDNIGIAKVEGYFAYPGGDWIILPMGKIDMTYYLDITMPNDQVGAFSYYFVIYDTSNNMVQSDQVDVEVQDDEAPTASIAGPASGFQFEPMTFNAFGSTDNVGIASYKWEINGDPFEGSEVAYTFNEVGTYTIELKVSDDVNPSVAATHTVIIRDAEDPVIVVDIPTVIGNHLTLLADASGSTDNVGIVSYSWTIKLPDDTRKTGFQSIYQYDLTGLYGEIEITLMVRDAEGNSVTSSYVVLVTDLLPPVVKAPSNRSAYVDGLLKFSDQGSTDNLGIETYVWKISFGDLEVEKHGKTISYLFEEVGIYTITLTVIDAMNNSASAEFQVEILPQEATTDSDDDGMPDWWEEENGLDKNKDDAQRDYDRDLLTNIREYQLGTDPNDPDMDKDGLPDNWEYKYGYDKDKTALIDGVPQWMVEFKATDDLDGDGATNLEEYLDGDRDPKVKDADEEEKDSLTWMIVIAVMIALVVALLVAGFSIYMVRLRSVNEEFPEEQYPHLYNK